MTRRPLQSHGRRLQASNARAHFILAFSTRPPSTSAAPVPDPTTPHLPRPPLAVRTRSSSHERDEARRRRWRRPALPPHPGFFRGLCILCRVKEEDTAEGGVPELAIGDDGKMKMMERGGDEAAAAAAARCPPHPGFVRGLCSLCGAKEEDVAGGSASGLAAGYKFELPKWMLLVQPESHLETLLRQKKLTLILDLDHTLLNTTAFDNFSPLESANGFSWNTEDDLAMGLFRMEGHGIPMIAKLRPFARDFLEQASGMFEMHVYTLADPAYARAAVSLLDPAYFGERIVSRAESTRTWMKSLDVIPGAEVGAVVILDDTDTVWMENQGNLILIERYTYFASACTKFGYDIRSMAEENRDEREHDGPLAVALQVLKRVHKDFFDLAIEGYYPDVRELIGEVRRRREVLRDCTLAFNQDFAEGTPMWELAERLGAVCKVGVDETVTHVVAEDPGTERAQWARDNNKFLVNPEWINAASFRWSRVNEQDFPVLPGA